MKYITIFSLFIAYNHNFCIAFPQAVAPQNEAVKIINILTNSFFTSFCEHTIPNPSTTVFGEFVLYLLFALSKKLIFPYQTHPQDNI